MFCKSSSSKTGFQSRCKECEKSYRKENKDKIAARAKKYKKENPERIKASQKKYIEANKEYLKEWHKQWHLNNREGRLAKSRLNYQNNKDSMKESKKLWVEKNMERYRSYQEAYRRENKEKERLRVSEWREKNLERILSESRIFYHKNKIQENNRKKAWNKKNPHKGTAYAASRRAAKLKATPPWLGADHKLQIFLIYKNAAEMRANGSDVHVDHIIPLQHPLVCGLHVPWNLKIISAFDNLSKSNKFSIDV